MYMKILKKKGLMSAVTAYMPQVGCPNQENDEFYEKLDTVLREFPEEECDSGKKLKQTRWKERR